MKNSIPLRLVPILLNSLFPPQCLSCKTPVQSSGNLCSSCWEELEFITAPFCSQCGIPLPANTIANLRCAGCIATPPYFDKARAALRYCERSGKLIAHYKYYDQLLFTSSFASWMKQTGSTLLEQSHYLMPVPMHRSRLFLRHYNQAALLARSISRDSAIRCLTDGLIRNRNTPPQTTLSFENRQKNVRTAFTVNPKHRSRIQKKTITLIDDVMTTGATLNACARILKESGAASVYVLTLARTVKGR